MKLKGIVPPLVTPLLGRDTLDFEGLERLVGHTIGGGVSGLFILGTTGEAPSLSYRLRRELITEVVRLIDARVPVLVGITDTSFVESCHVAQHAADCGAAAVVLSTPYYFPAGQTELTSYVERIAGELPLPLVLYNMPSLTKVWFELDTIQRLAHLENVVGVKDSSGDLQYFESLISLRALRPDWFFMIGPEHLLPQAMRMGGDGGVNGGANIFPEIFVGLYRAIRDSDTSAEAMWMEKVSKLQQIYDIGKYASRHIKATKCALSLKGICSDFLAEPFNHFLPPERARVEELLQQIA